MRRRSMELVALLTGLGGTPKGAWDGVRVTGIATDSRRVEAGDLFVALPGTHSHGRYYIGEALGKGAVACLLEGSPADALPVAGLVVDDGQTVLPDVAARLYGHPGRRLVIAGVTGTNGKTTTALLTAHLLRYAGLKVAYWTTTEASHGEGTFRPKWTTPHAHDLQRLLAEAADGGASHAVIEVSSHGIAQERIRHIPFAAAMVTNVTPDHLDFHGDFPHYVATKRRFVGDLPPAAAAILNADDARVRAFAQATRAGVTLTGRDRRAALRALYVRQATDGTAFRLRGRANKGPAMDVRVRLALAGMHNVRNALQAVAASLILGVDPDVIPKALAAFAPPPRRLERHTLGCYTVLNDVAMNEASYDTVLGTLAAASVPRPVVVHAVRGNRGVDVNRRIARILARWNRDLSFSPVIVTLSEDTLASYPVDYAVRDEELAATLAAAADDGLETDVHRTLEGAVAAAVDRLEPGGTLVLLGTFGMDDGPALALSRLASRTGLEPGTLPRYPRQSDAVQGG